MCDVLPKYLKYYYTQYPSQKELDQCFPVNKIDFEALRSPPTCQIQATWIGHSTMLVQMGGITMLTDPVFSQRCSMSQMSGPKRLRPPPFTLKQLIVTEQIPIDIVLISHNHYDHLDYYSVQKIAKYMLHYSTNTNNGSMRGVQFIVPLGVKAWFKKHVPNSLIGKNSVIELDWHEQTKINEMETMDMKKEDFDGLSSIRDVSVTAIPMQHWSNRYGWDKDKTLWCGFSVVATIAKNKSIDSREDVDDLLVGGESNNDDWKELKFLFLGDTGWFDALYDIGNEFGPFDIAALPIGVYTPEYFMKPMHMSPDDAVRMMTAIQAKKALPIHWGTFYLAAESIIKPKEQLIIALTKAGIDKSTFPAWFIGDTILSD